MGLEEPALVMVMQVTNKTSSTIDASPYGLFNFHLGVAPEEAETRTPIDEEARGMRSGAPFMSGAPGRERWLT